MLIGEHDRSIKVLTTTTAIKNDLQRQYHPNMMQPPLPFESCNVNSMKRKDYKERIHIEYANNSRDVGTQTEKKTISSSLLEVNKNALANRLRGTGWQPPRQLHASPFMEPVSNHAVSVAVATELITLPRLASSKAIKPIKSKNTSPKSASTSTVVVKRTSLSGAAHPPSFYSQQERVIVVGGSTPPVKDKIMIVKASTTPAQLKAASAGIISPMLLKTNFNPFGAL